MAVVMFEKGNWERTSQTEAGGRSRLVSRVVLHTMLRPRESCHLEGS